VLGSVHGKLPFTGLDLMWAALAALMLVVSGVGLRRVRVHA
jgi:hypothetical protein